MKTSLACLLCCLFASQFAGWAQGAASTQVPFTVPGAPFWQWQAPTPAGYDLTAIDALDDQTAVAVGYHGAALKTTDQGHSWQQLSLGINYDLKAVSFVTPQLGWVAYNTPPTNPPYNQSGRGEIRKTTNGGQSWTVQPIGEPSDIEMQSLHFFSATEGYVFYYYNAPGASRPSRLRVTHDGGTTWRAVPIAADVKVCQFVTPLTGYLTTGSTVLKTTNGGLTFTTITPPGATAVTLNQLAFADAQHGWLASIFYSNLSDPNFYRTTDGGASWTPVNILGPTSTGYPPVYNLAFAPDGLHGVASQYATADGGQTWQLAPSGSLYYGATQLRPSGVGFAAGPYGQLLTTTDFGRSGHRGDSTLAAKFERVKFPDPLHGWALGGYYPKTLVRTSDRGAHWQPQHVASHAPGVQWVGGGLLAGTFPDADTAYVAGQEYLGPGNTPLYVLKTVDAGQSWTRLPLNGVGSINDLEFRDCRFGLVVGNQGEVWYTRTGGRSWQRGSSGTTQPLRTISWADAHTAYVQGDDSTFIKTTDGGQTWQPVATTLFSLYGSTSNTQLTTIQFVTAQVGFVSSGFLLRTADGGQTWTLITTNTNQVNGVQGVSFASAREGWAYGNRVFHTTDAGLTWAVQADVGLNQASGSFLDRYNGWVAGDNGMLVRYSEKFIQADTTRSQGLAYCAGNSLTLAFTTEGSLSQLPTDYRVQVSNARGRFRRGETLTLTPTAASTARQLTVALPATLPAGSRYRLRVIAADSTVLGGDNAQNLTFTALPATPVVRQLAGGQLAVSAPVVGAAYQWYRNGQLLVGATGPAYPAGGGAVPVAGSYTVVATLGSCASAASAPLAVVLATQGATVQSLRLYPNPAHTAIALSFTGLPATATQVQATLLDATGRTIGQHMLSVTGGNLPLAGLAPGLYVVRLTAQDAQGQGLGELPAQRVSVE